MDPNETLKRLREHVKSLEDSFDYVDEVAEEFTALDEWLSRGGFPPDDWVRNQRGT